MSIVVIGGVFGVAALLWILRPLVGRKGAAAVQGQESVHDDVAERTLLLYQELEEIDLEHEQGDLTTEEYTSLRETQKQRVLALLQDRQRDADALTAAKEHGDTSALSDAIEAEILRIRARRRGQREEPADLQAAADSALAAGRGLHWLWVGVPALLVLLAFGAIFQLYRASSRTLTEQTPIAQINVSAPVGFAFVAPDHVLLGNASGLLESRDGGRTWDRSSLEVAPTVLAASPAGDGSAYVFSGQDVHATADAGRTWQTVTGTLPGTLVLAAAVNPYAPTEVYASFADAGLQRSRDGGRSWEPIVTPDSDTVVAILVSGIPPLLFIAVESGRVQVSSDEGETWRAASGAVTMALRGPVRALAGAADGGVLYAAAHTGLFLSTAAGQTWVDLPLRKPLIAVAVDPTTDRTVLAVTESGEVYRSTDGGIAWRNEQ